MAKILLLVLLCLTYHAAASIILAPVTFQTTTATDTQVTDVTNPTSNTGTVVAPDPIVPAIDPQTDPAPSNTVPAETSTDTGLVIAPPEPSPAQDSSEVEPIPSIIEPEDSKKESDSNDGQSPQSKAEYPPSNQKSKEKPNPKAKPKKNKRALPLEKDETIILIKAFPDNNPVQASANNNKAEKIIGLLEKGEVQLSFFTHSISSQKNGAEAEVILDININGKTTSVPVTQGLTKEQLTFSGQKGQNILEFSLSGKTRGQGLVYVLLTSFKWQLKK